jgi:hypothetical protein
MIQAFFIALEEPLKVVKMIVMRIFLGVLILTTGTMLMGQDLEKHEWKSRLVLIHASELESDHYQRQMAILEKEKAGLEERKLLVYTFWKDKYRVGFGDTEWKMADKGFSEWTNPDSGFEILLIGLDGGVKLRQDEVIDAVTLFARIDAMPMRRQELNNK